MALLKRRPHGVVTTEAGIGLGILPQGITRLHRRRHGFKSIALNDAWAQREPCLCFRQWSELSMPRRSLLDHLGRTSRSR